MSQPNQFMFPRLEMRILNSQVEPKTGNIQGQICSDDRSWKKGNKACRDYSVDGHNCSDVGDNGVKASEACKVACNTCPVDIKIKRDLQHTYNRLPSPVEDIDDPYADNIINQGEWKPGVRHDISRNPEDSDKMDELEEKIDAMRRSMPNLKCLCSDIKKSTDSKDTDHVSMQPHRCGDALSTLMKWDGLHRDMQSKDTDVRYKIACEDPTNYQDRLINPQLRSKEDKNSPVEDVYYNCTRQRWEVKGKTDSKFTPYDFKTQGKLRCKRKCSTYDEDKKVGCPTGLNDHCKKEDDGTCVEKSDETDSSKSSKSSTGQTGKKDKTDTKDDRAKQKAAKSKQDALGDKTDESVSATITFGLKDVTQTTIDRHYDSYSTALETEIKAMITSINAGEKYKVVVFNITKGSLQFDVEITPEGKLSEKDKKDKLVKILQAIDSIMYETGTKTLKKTHKFKTTGTIPGVDTPIFKTGDEAKLTIDKIIHGRVRRPVNLTDEWKILAIYGFVSAIAVVISVLSNDKNIWGLKLVFLMILPLLYVLMMYINKETTEDDIRRKLMWVFSGVMIIIMYALISGQKMKSKAFSQYQGKARGFLSKLGAVNPMTILTTTAGIGTSISGLVGLL